MRDCNLISFIHWLQSGAKGYPQNEEKIIFVEKYENFSLKKTLTGAYYLILYYDYKHSFSMLLQPQNTLIFIDKLLEKYNLFQMALKRS